jgi:hypothetical protein
MEGSMTANITIMPPFSSFISRRSLDNALMTTPHVSMAISKPPTNFGRASYMLGLLAFSLLIFHNLQGNAPCLAGNLEEGLSRINLYLFRNITHETSSLLTR